MSAGPRAVIASFAIAASMVVMTLIDPRLAAVAALLLPPPLIIGVLAAGRTVSIERERNAMAVSNHTFLFDFLRGIARLRAAGCESSVARRWETQFRAQLDLEERLHRWQIPLHMLDAAYPLWAFCVIVLAASTGVDQASSPDGAEFLGFALALGLCVGETMALASAVSTFAQSRLDSERLQPILEENVEGRAPRQRLAAAEIDGVTPSGRNGTLKHVWRRRSQRRSEGIVPVLRGIELCGGIEARDLQFQYDGADAPVLDGLSLHAKPGEVVAIVGPSGSGKSTLLRLLLGFERPQRGEVFYDGVPFAELDPSTLRAQIGTVLQEDQIRVATLRYNIAGSAPRHLNEVWHAARLTGLERDIRQMPMGIQTIMEESRVSSGQKQRVLLAARLVRQPRILLLDEATSALNEDLEREVLNNLRSLGITCLVASHRASTVAHADRVYVIDGGRVVQSGRPAELLSVDGPLRRMHARQRFDESEYPMVYAPPPSSMKERVTSTV